MWRRSRPHRPTSDGEDPPRAGHALELVRAAVRELEPGPATRSRTVCETRISDGPARAVTRAPIDTARPPTLPSIVRHSPVCSPARSWIPRPETPSRWPVRTGSRERARRTPRRSRPPRCRAPTAVAREAAADEAVVLVDELLPADVAELRLARGRADDVGEENGRKDALELRLLVPQLADEALDRVEIRVARARHDGRSPCPASPRAGHPGSARERGSLRRPCSPPGSETSVGTRIVPRRAGRRTRRTCETAATASPGPAETGACTSRPPLDDCSSNVMPSNGLAARRPRPTRGSPSSPVDVAPARARTRPSRMPHG